MLKYLVETTEPDRGREILELLPYYDDDEVIDLIFALLTVTITVEPPNIIDWAEECFFIVETKRPIVFEPVQKRVLQAFFEWHVASFRYRTGLYSTIKKSGKTTVAAVVTRWAAECWGDYGEVYHMGNKLEQAKQRAFKIVKRSIELSPYKDDWLITATKMTHLPTQSFIQALPVNAAGEAGGNQRLTTWTEFHGYIYEDAERMYSELQPVPTQSTSFRMVESYAGYIGESNLLKGIWDRAKPPEEPERYRIDDEFPIYAVPEDGLVAYIDTGVEARRMRWQTPKYYIQAEREELPNEFRRIHLNEWVSSQDSLINIAMWDRLKTEIEVDDPKRLSVVLAIDASVSGDCTALVVIAYVPSDDDDNDMVRIIESHVWQPEKGKKIQYSETLTPAIESAFERYNVIGVAYDEYQMHHYMTEMRKKPEYEDYGDSDKPEEFWYAFPQGAERLRADTDLLKRIRDERLEHNGNEDLRTHVRNADGKKVNDKAIRIVKRSTSMPIDLIVATSMGAWRIYTLHQIEPEETVIRFGVARY